jgi:hypothetical protein
MQLKPDAELFAIVPGLWQGWFTIYRNGRSLGQWHGYDARSALYAMLQSEHRDMLAPLPGQFPDRIADGSTRGSRT